MASAKVASGVASSWNTSNSIELRLEAIGLHTIGVKSSETSMLMKQKERGVLLEARREEFDLRKKSKKSTMKPIFMEPEVPKVRKSGRLSAGIWIGTVAASLVGSYIFWTQELSAHFKDSSNEAAEQNAENKGL